MYCKSKLLAVGHKHRACHFVVFCLGKQVSSHERGIGFAVCQYQNLGRTCNHINGNLAIYLALGFRHESVTGAHDFIYSGNRLGAVCQCSNRLRTADLEDFVHACNLCSAKDCGIYLTVTHGRRDHDDLAHACKLGGNTVHQHGGGISSSTARDVNTNLCQRRDFLSEHNAAVFLDFKALAHLIFMICFNICGCVAHHADKIGIAVCKCICDLLLGNLQRIELDLVKFFCISQQCSVLLRFDVCDNVRYCVLHVEGVLGAVENFLIRNRVEIVYANHDLSPFFAPAAFFADR